MKTKKLLTCFMLLCLALSSTLATEFKYGDLYYEITSEDSLEVAVVYNYEYRIEGEEWIENQLKVANIPDVVIYEDKTYKVTRIEKRCFEYCYSLQTVTIGQNVRSIGEEAFYQCGIKELVIPDNVTVIDYEAFGYTPLVSVTLSANLTELGGYAFWHCTSLTNIVLPNSLLKIGSGAFASCSSLTEIIVPDNVTSIGSNAFSFCSNLEKVILPNSLSTIESSTFSSCSNLVDIDIPQSVTSIKSSAFRSCTALQNITIPSSVSTIEANVFKGCTALQNITIPASVTAIESNAFEGCTALQSISIPASVTTINKEAFYNCSSLENLTMGGNEISIYDKAFWGCHITEIHWNGTIEEWCNNLKRVGSYSIFPSISASYDLYIDNQLLISLSFPETMTKVRESAFENCKSITDVIIGEQVTYIGSCCFMGCINIETLTVGKNTKIESGQVFQGCGNLTKVYWMDSLEDWCNNQIASDFNVGYDLYIDGTLQTDVVIPKNVTSIARSAFSRCNLKSVIIGDNVTNMESSAFSLCDSLQSVTIGKGITEIKKNTFSGCTNLVDVTLGNQIYNILDNAFSNCSNLSTITLPLSLRNIRSEAFNRCDNLTQIVLPNQVSSIERYAFNCKNLKDVYTLKHQPCSVNAYAFGYTSPTIHLPLGAYSDYAADANWSKLNLAGYDTITNVYPTSCYLEAKVIAGTNEPLHWGIVDESDINDNVLEFTTLQPESEYQIPLYYYMSEEIVDTLLFSFTTSPLTLTTLPSKPVATNVAILFAETNMAEVETNCGFEWKRYDAPEGMPANKVYCPIMNGEMIGRLKNLKDDVYYQCRAFYTSAAGNTHYGDWQFIFTGDVLVEFDPLVYTYAATGVSDSGATLTGTAIAGSEDITEQGIEYWAEERTPNYAPRRAPRSTIGEHQQIPATGMRMQVTLNDLDEGTVYHYRTYAKVGDETIYGAEMSFTTKGTYKFTVIFVDYDGTIIDEQQVPYGSAATEPDMSDHEREGYLFDGWDTDFSSVTDDLTITATYTIITALNETTIDGANNADEEGRATGKNGSQTSDSPRKIIYNSQLYILLPTGEIYSPLGVRVR